MHSPYTPQPVDALMAAQTSVGVVLGAALCFRPLRPWPATALVLAAIVLAVFAPVEGDFLHGFGMTTGPNHFLGVLTFVSLLALGAMAITRRWALVAVAAVGALVLGALDYVLQESNAELAAAHLAFLGLLLGLHWRLTPAPRAGESEGEAARESGAPLETGRGFARDDLVAFGAGTLLASVCCWVVLHAQTNSGDEWGNTYQAALFAHFRAYATPPHCWEAFRSFYVFEYMGRLFTQYTPGWPYFMAPFVGLHVPWLAGPVALGVLAVAMARLGRRAAAGFSPGDRAPSLLEVRKAGWLAAGVVVLSSTVLINGGSRYPHVFVCAMFAWSVETLFAMGDGSMARSTVSEQRKTGALLGLCSALMLSARPGDGAMLGIGLFVYFVYGCVRRRFRWQAIAAAAAAFAFVSGLTLVVLRLQLGVWFKTGYSLNEIIYPWNVPKWSVPHVNEFKWGIPLATGSYCWWPCSPAVGLLGLAALRGRARRMSFVFFLSAVPLVVFYTLSELGRNFDFGYGPRYQLVLVVPMGVGTGVVLAQLWSGARARVAAVAGERPYALGGAAAVALVAVLLGVVRIAPLVYPNTYADVRDYHRLKDAIDTASLHDAIVFGGIGLNSTDPMDLTENLPLDLYPNQNVLIANDTNPTQVQCVKTTYRGRRFFHALPGPTVRIVPF